MEVLRGSIEVLTASEGMLIGSIEVITESTELLTRPENLPVYVPCLLFDIPSLCCARKPAACSICDLTNMAALFHSDPHCTLPQRVPWVLMASVITAF